MVDVESALDLIAYGCVRMPYWEANNRLCGGVGGVTRFQDKVIEWRGRKWLVVDVHFENVEHFDDDYLALEPHDG